MPTNRTLRAVTEDVSSTRALSVTEAADHGSYRELLIAVRTRVAKAVQSENTQSRDLASLTLRLFDIAKQLEGLDAAEGVDDVGSAAATVDEEWASS